MKRLILYLCLLCVAVGAQATTLQGTIDDGGTVAAFSRITFDLRNCNNPTPARLSTGAAVPSTTTIFVPASGVLSGTLAPTDDMSCGSTPYYHVTLVRVSGVTIWERNYAVTGATFDISIAPALTILPAVAIPVTNPNKGDFAVVGTIYGDRVNVYGQLLMSGLATPVNSAFFPTTTGGSLVPAQYWYRVTATNGAGESLPSPQTAITVGAGTNTNTVSVNWEVVPGATGYKIYGRTNGAQQLIAAVSSSSTSYVDTGAITPSGALPTVNSSSLLSVPTLQLVSGVQPACSVSTRGWFWYVAGGVGVKDTVNVCAKDVSNAYAWRVLY